MDLLSDFQKDKWSNKGVPPSGYKDLTAHGYAAYNIFRRANNEEAGQGLAYYLSTDAGVPCQAVIYGADRDPLKSIGHAYMKMKKVKETNVVTGLIVEDDYVEMNDAFLATVKVPEPEKKRPSVVDLSIAGDLKLDKWEKKGQPPKIKSDLGYTYYNIVRETPESQAGGLQYYLSTSEGVLLEAVLFDAERDPLKSIGNCFLKICHKKSPKTIVGIIVEDDWVERK